jgi:hypothetical protein
MIKKIFFLLFAFYYLSVNNYAQPLNSFRIEFHIYSGDTLLRFEHKNRNYEPYTPLETQYLEQFKKKHQAQFSIINQRFLFFHFVPDEIKNKLVRQKFERFVFTMDKTGQYLILIAAAVDTKYLVKLSARFSDFSDADYIRFDDNKYRQNYAYISISLIKVADIMSDNPVIKTIVLRNKNKGGLKMSIKLNIYLIDKLKNKSKLHIIEVDKQKNSYKKDERGDNYLLPSVKF